MLIQSKVDYEKRLHIEQKLKDNCRDHGLEYLGETPRNGDCFFEAIASQLSRIGVSQSRPLLAPLQLRLKVSEYIRQHPTYKVSTCSVPLQIGLKVSEYIRQHLIYDVITCFKPL